jgi:hypothetical protein
VTDQLTPRRCSATTKAGSQCRAFAVRGTDPPLCSIHAGITVGGAPQGNRNAVTHGFYASTDISDVILDLASKQAQLSQLIDACFEKLDPRTIPDLARLLALHGQNASRIGRLLRDRQALTSETSDELTDAIDAALDELANGWQIEL